MDVKTDYAKSYQNISQISDKIPDKFFSFPRIISRKI